MVKVGQSSVSRSRLEYRSKCMRNLFHQARKHWPLWVALLVLWAATAAEVLMAMARTQGHLTYVFDDAYIHMAMARSLAQSGVWGITPAGFTSCSSSLLWTIGLATTYLLTGVRESTPLWLNLWFASGVLVAVYAIFGARQARPAYTLAVLLLVTFITPLPTMVLCGMEHIAHTLVCILFVYTAAILLGSQPKIGKPCSLPLIPSQREGKPMPPTDKIAYEESFGTGSSEAAAAGGKSRVFAWLVLLAWLLVMARYEGLFAIFIVGVLLAARGRWLQACALGAAGALPVVVYGFFSRAQGWFWLPNSVLLKGVVKGTAANIASGDFGYLRLTTLVKVVVGSSTLALLCGAFVLVLCGWRRSATLAPASLQALIIFVVMGALHFLLAKIVWFRYEAYIAALGVFVLALAVQDGALASLKPRPGSRIAPLQAAWMTLIFLLVPVVGLRGWNGVMQTPQASANIYQQQVQMARFIARYYNGKTVVLNDIGAPNYYAAINTVDLEGLCSLDVMQQRRRNQELPNTAIDGFATRHKASIAIVYEDWYRHWDRAARKMGASNLPAHWQRIGEWTISDNVVCGGDRVSIYAVAPQEAPALTEHLRAFAASLPPAVKQSGAYVQASRTVAAGAART